MSIQLKAMPFDSKEILDESTGETSYDRVAYSKDLADWLRSYFSNGILIHGGNTLQDQLKVVKKDGVKLGVKPGAIVINGRTGWVEKEEELTVDVGGSDHRIDRIVAELNIPSDRGIYLKVLKGNPSSNPSAPALTTTEDVYQIPLAQVRVNAGAAVIAEVTDERANHISNVLIGIKPPTGNDAAAISVSDEVKKIYKLSESERNVDDALKKAGDEGNAIYAIFLIKASVHSLAKAFGENGVSMGNLGYGLAKYAWATGADKNEYRDFLDKFTLDELLENKGTRQKLISNRNFDELYIETFAFNKIMPHVLKFLSDEDVKSKIFNKKYIKYMLSSGQDNVQDSNGEMCFLVSKYHSASISTRHMDLREMKKIIFYYRNYDYTTSTEDNFILYVNGREIFRTREYTNSFKRYEVEIPQEYRKENVSFLFTTTRKLTAYIRCFKFS